MLFISTPVLAQDPDVSVIEELAELITDVNVLNGTSPPKHDGHDHGHAMDKKVETNADAGDGSHHESPTFTDADRTATIAGSLLMVFIVAAGLLIAYVLNVYKKKMDDQLQLEV